MIVLYDQLLPANSTFRPMFKHGVPSVDMLGNVFITCVECCGILNRKFIYGDNFALFFCAAASTGQISGKEARKFLIRYLVSFNSSYHVIIM